MNPSQSPEEIFRDLSHKLVHEMKEYMRELGETSSVFINRVTEIMAKEVRELHSANQAQLSSQENLPS